ncbi:LAMI_0H13256g1_1 [Lachancea mirantina]|uniref:LAMI_0H13256g1_1 n=1 Tax=Lachancea mirantina TaxID=1230905 RepID=A0A1G4KHP3_9SACH|nr:LAMI_0H13256g1_1 [Lachancea mirantina]
MASEKGELGVEQRRQVYLYFCALRDFFSISGDRQDRSSSARAQKARSKLLKLQPSQFFELSTDVHDELQRRIDENQAQPDHLLPRDSFHVKRNQARQKLANLSKTRFNDLVDDILYEIQRRGYEEALPDVRNLDEENFNDAPEQTPKELKDAVISRNDQPKLEELKNEAVRNLAPSASLQASQIIPQKASIEWSSDEETQDSSPHEDREPPASFSEGLPDGLHEGSTSEPQAEDTGMDSNAVGPDVDEVSDSLSPALPSFDEKLKDTKLNKMASRGGSISRASLGHENKDREIQVLVAEGTRMDKRISELERLNSELENERISLNRDVQEKQNEVDELQRNLNELRREILNSKGKLKQLEEKSRSQPQVQSPKPTVDNKLHEELTRLTSRLNILSVENENLKQQNSELELNLKNAASSPNRKSVSILAESPEQLLTEERLKEHIASDGRVPLSFVTALHSQVCFFLKRVRSERSQKDFGDQLFDNIARISDIIHKIITLVNTPDNTEKVALLKSSLSYAITTVRYFALYKDLLPLVTVNTAISDVCFASCNLLSMVKISTSENDQNLGPIDSLTNPETPRESTTPFFSNEDVKEQEYDLEDPREHSSFIYEEQTSMSPVKPLKITQKVISLSSTPTKTSSNARKPSSTLFNSIISPKSTSPMQNKMFEDSSAANQVEASKGGKSASDEKSRVGALRVQRGVVQDIGSQTIDKENFNPSRDSTFAERDKGALREPQEKSQKSLYNRVLPNLFSKKEESKKSSEVEINALFPSERNIPVEDVKHESSTVSESTKGLPPAPIQNQGGTGPTQGLGEIYGVRNEIPSLSATKVGKSGPVETKTVGQASEPLTLKMGSLREKQLEKNGPQESLSNDISEDSLTSGDDTQDDAINGKIDESNATSEEEVPFQPVKTEYTSDSYDTPSNKGVRKTNDSKIDCDNNGKNGVNEIQTQYKLSNREVDQDKSASKAKSMNERPLMHSETQSPVKLEETELLPSTLSEKPIKSETPTFTITTPEEAEPKNKSNFAQNVHAHGKESIKDASDVDSVRRARQSRQGLEQEADFDIDAFDIENPDNTLSELLLYLEHRTIEVISTIQSLLTSIKQPQATTGELRLASQAIKEVISQMVGATSVSMDQSRNAALREHGSWVVQSLDDCKKRIISLCQLKEDADIESKDGDEVYANKHFKQRLAGIAFDIAKCTKELVKTVEEASLKEEIAFLNSRLSH